MLTSLSLAQRAQTAASYEALAASSAILERPFLGGSIFSRERPVSLPALRARSVRFKPRQPAPFQCSISFDTHRKAPPMSTVQITGMQGAEGTDRPTQAAPAPGASAPVDTRKKYVMTLQSADKTGLVATITTALAKHGMNILELNQFTAGGIFFFHAVFENEAQTSDDVALGAELSAAVADGRINNAVWAIHPKEYRPRVLIMVSKASHCLNDLLHRWQSGSLPIDIVAVVSNHDNILRELPSWYKVPFHFIPVTHESKAAGEYVLGRLIEDLSINLVVMARYMQILSPELIARLPCKVINIHHSFLPGFKGAKPYHAAYNRGVKLIGATAHYATSDLDEGPIIDQETIRVRHDHTPQQLEQLGRDVECLVLARAVKYHAEHRVFVNGGRTVVFD